MLDFAVFQVDSTKKPVDFDDIPKAETTTVTEAEVKEAETKVEQPTEEAQPTEKTETTEVKTTTEETTTEPTE